MSDNTGKEIWKPGNMLYPLPAVMVSCKRKNERPNIITVAWTGTVCSEPPMLSVSITPKRFSHDIIRDTGNVLDQLFVFSFVLEKRGPQAAVLIQRSAGISNEGSSGLEGQRIFKDLGIDL